MVIKGSGGEGKSQVGVTLSRLFGVNAKDGSVGKVSENCFARADLEHIHLMIDDDMRMEALKQTNYNCRSQSEFIENAILFYLGYLTADKPKSFLPSMFLSTMKGIVAESDNRTSGLLFKIAVELAILQNLIAATNEVDELTMTKLRGECIKEVKRIHGIFTMEKAMDWQSE